MILQSYRVIELYVIESLERVSVSLFRWFQNILKRNVHKYHFLVSTSQKIILSVDNFKIKNSDCKKLLGFKFNSKHSFDHHITDLCRRANRKIQGLVRVASFMNLSKQRLLMNSFFKIQFSYRQL